MTATLEHLNFSVPAPKQLAERLCRLFDWKIRWEGEGIDDGHTVHVGDDARYLALYAPPAFTHEANPRYTAKQAINHIGLLTQDLAEVRQKVLDEGLEIHFENAVAPGKRFYFLLDGIEFEVVEY